MTGYGGEEAAPSREVGLCRDERLGHVLASPKGSMRRPNTQQP